MVQLSETRQKSREHPRIKTKLLGRYLLADRREFRCTIVDVALGGIALTGPERGAIGETVIVYIDQLGQVQGNIVRFLEGGFALKLTATTSATEKLAHRLDELQAHNTLISFPGRREPRIEPEDKVAFIKGEECEIIDLSLTGADVKIGHRPEIGALVQIGHLRGTVMRHSRSGVSIEFVDVPDGATLTDRLVLASAIARGREEIADILRDAGGSE